VDAAQVSLSHAGACPELFEEGLSFRFAGGNPVDERIEIEAGMNRERIIARLRENQATLRKRGVAHAALFGSRARCSIMRFEG
jgi:hypothetical protein